MSGTTPRAISCLEDLRRIADESHRAAVALALRLLDLAQRGIEVGCDEVEVARLDAAVEVVRVDVHDQAHAVVHGDRERLGAAHAATAGGQHQPARAAIRRSAARATAAKVSYVPWTMPCVPM